MSSLDQLLTDPMWGPLSVDVDPNSRETIAAQEKVIAEQRQMIALRDNQIKRLKAKEANNGVQVLTYLQSLERKFEIVADAPSKRPLSLQFQDFSESAQRRIISLEKRLQLRDDAMQLINAMLVDTITTKDAEIDALTIDLELAKELLEAMKSPQMENLHIVRQPDGSRSSMISDY